MLLILPLLGCKFVSGVLVGIIFDLCFKKQEVVEVEHVEEDHECHVHHEENTKLHKYFIHPLIHSLEIFAYVLIINLALGFIIGFVGEENFTNFLLTNKYLTPLFASIIGLIPNCSSSLLLSKVFVQGSLSFGALLAGLLVNSGLGMMLLLKNRKTAKHVLLIVGVCFGVAVIAGYITCLIVGF